MLPQAPHHKLYNDETLHLSRVNEKGEILVHGHYGLEEAENWHRYLGLVPTRPSIDPEHLNDFE